MQYSRRVNTKLPQQGRLKILHKQKYSKGTFRGQLMQKHQFSLYAVLIPQCLGMILIAESCMSHVYLGSSLMLSKSGFQKSCRGN